MKHASVCVFIVRNPYSGHKYLCGAFQSSAMLFEWVEAMQRFMLIKVSERMTNHIKKHKVHPCTTLQSCVFVSVQSIDLSLPCPLEVFEMLVVPEQHYPLVCVAVSKGSHPDQVVTLALLIPMLPTQRSQSPVSIRVSLCLNSKLTLFGLPKRVLLMGLV